MGKLNSVIVRTVAARGDKGGRECSVLFDSGATDSFVSREVAEALGTILPLTDPNAYTLADGSKLHVKEGVTLTLYLHGRPITDHFKVNPSDGGANIDDVILGATTMSKYGISVDFKHNDIAFSLKHDHPAPGAKQQTKGAVNMNELLKRILARMGMTEIPESLTDEDAISMICDRYSRGYKAVAVPGILAALALKEDATETDAKTAIEALKMLQQKKPEPAAEPAPGVKYASVFAKIGITASAEVTEEQAVDLIAAQVKKPAPATAVASKAILAVLSLPETSTEEEVVGAILATQHPGNVVTVDQHKDLERQHREFRLNSLITSAMQSGKLTPAEKGWIQEQITEWEKIGLDGLTTLEKFLDKRPKLMPIGERLPVKTPSDTDLDADTMAVARQMGVGQETLKKYAQ